MQEFFASEDIVLLEFHMPLCLCESFFLFDRSPDDFLLVVFDEGLPLLCFEAGENDLLRGLEVGGFLSLSSPQSVDGH